MSNICIIPARGGSKRIPKKNIKVFRGKPMIYWVIRAAFKSECFDKIIVSTDSLEIAEIVKNLGAEVPFLRPNNLSGDHSSVVDVVKHSIKEIKKELVDLQNICCLYATANLISYIDIKNSYDVFINENLNKILFAATLFEYPIQRALVLDKNNYASMLDKNNLYTRSQDLIETYHDAGQFYWGNCKSWLKTKNILDGGKAYIIPKWRVQDIDVLDDWDRAEMMHQVLENKKLI